MITKILGFLGTLIPILFPDKEFQPKRLGALIVCFGLALGAIALLGEESTKTALGVAEIFLELSED